MPATLAGRVAIVDVAASAHVARALAGAGAAVVLVGGAASDAGALAADLADRGARVAVFVGDSATDSGRDALVEMVAELFA